VNNFSLQSYLAGGILYCGVVGNVDETAPTSVRRNSVMHPDEIAAVILYDEIASGFRAKDVCDRLAFGLAGNVGLRVSLWRTDVLKDSTESNLALSDAATADLVVLALRSAKLLSKAVREWLENWAAASHAEDAALVVLAGESEGVLSPMAAHQLHEFATSHGIKCFCQSEQAQAGHPSAFLVEPAQLPRSDPPLPSIPERPGQYAHWGLND
jgi:hypothetical protein